MKTITSNNTKVIIEEEQGKTIVKVDTPDADIYINGVCVLSKYDKPEYNDVPVVLRPFIEGKADYIKSEEKQVITDLWTKGSHVCATFYIPKNTRKAITARLDLISSMEEFEHDYLRNRTNIDDETANKLVEEFKSLFNDIEKSVNEAGFKLRFSHTSGDFLHGWWDVIFSLKDWNEDSFLSIWKKFSHFDQRLNEVVDKYGH